MSPFSMFNNYSLYAYPCRPRPPCNISQWEQGVLDFIASSGAAAYFQICFGSKQKRKLNGLSRAGLAYRYRLDGQRSINVLASKPYDDVDSLLRSLVFSQFLLKIKQWRPLALEGDGPVHAYVSISGSQYPVIVFRATDNPIILPLLAGRFKRLFVLAEKYDPEFNKIKTPVKIILDDDLLSDDPLFPAAEQSIKACNGDINHN